MAVAAPRPRLDLSDDFRHLYGAIVAIAGSPAGLDAGGGRLDGRARRRGVETAAAGSARPRRNLYLSRLGLGGDRCGQAIERGLAAANLDPDPCRRPVLFRRRAVLPLGKPEISERHLARLRHRRRGLPICRHSSGLRARRLTKKELGQAANPAASIARCTLVWNSESSPLARRSTFCATAPHRTSTHGR